MTGKKIARLDRNKQFISKYLQTRKDFYPYICNTDFVDQVLSTCL